MRRIAVPLIFGLAGIAVLVSLGVWQLRRLHWKEGVLARIEARLAEIPVALPDNPDPVADRYLAVTVTGTFADGVVRVLSGQKDVGAGYRLISPFVTDAGRRVLVDRGFVVIDASLPQVAAGPETVTGNLLWPDDRNSATPDNDLAANIWFARDVGALAQALGTEPLLIVTRTLSVPEAAVAPVPVDTAAIPNDHLNYAITWFSLAFVWLAMSVYFLRRQAGSTKG